MKIFLSCFILFLCFFLLFSLVIGARTPDPARPDKGFSSSIVAMAQSRFDKDKDFRFFVELMIITGFGNLLVGSFLTAVVGLRQSVFWSFIGGYLLVAVIEGLLLLYARFYLGSYSYLCACAAGIVCAFFVYRHNVRRHGYGHSRFHRI